MKYCSWILLMFFFSFFKTFSQEKHIKHIVQKGETVYKIAQQYHVKANTLLELNPEAKEGVKINSILIIPTNAIQNCESVVETYHEVLPKETLYGISRQYGVKVDDLYKANPNLQEEGLKVSQKIKIPTTNFKTVVKTSNPVKTEGVLVVEAVKSPAEVIEYEVLSKETLYSIARQHGITVVELQNLNPSLENSTLKSGQKIIIPKKVDSLSKLNGSKKVEEKSVDLAQNNMADLKEEYIYTRKILPKETKFGIAKDYGISVAELEKQNPTIVKQFSIGTVLRISTSKVLESPTTKEVVVNENVTKLDTDNKNVLIHDAAFVDQLIQTASDNIGVPYRSGGVSRDGFDCSGLIYTTFASHDVVLPRSSKEMSNCGIVVDANEAQKGDLIFFTTSRISQINHVGMVIEVLDGEIKFIHASSSSGVIISSTKESYYEKKFAQINRVLD